MLAHDTRSSAAALCQAAAAGIAAVEGSAEQPRLLTTPQLHWMVAHRNQDQPCSEVDYYDSLLGAFEQLVSTFCASASAQVRQPCSDPTRDLNICITLNVFQNMRQNMRHYKSYRG